MYTEFALFIYFICLFVLVALVFKGRLSRANFNQILELGDEANLPSKGDTINLRNNLDIKRIWLKAPKALWIFQKESAVWIKYYLIGVQGMLSLAL